ncbi:MULTISPECIES: hypothetical protein [Thermoactinomyces]|uniref:hypothetical protein n=1 Tax=Thermoactinomyces TaxID=2023 RepID=UPI001C68AA1F|nr:MULTISPECIES: hypothetical protein [Thermoactinomyces]
MARRRWTDTDKKKQIGVLVDGCVFANDQNQNVDLDEFVDAFLEWVESKGWHFGGGVRQVDEDGEPASCGKRES